VISTIILKALTKNSEDRCKSAAGVQVDLEKCLQRLRPDNTIEAHISLILTKFSNYKTHFSEM
jgi:hypothetical protein